MKKLLSFIFLLSFLLFASQVQAIPPMRPSGGCTTFSCLAGIPSTIAGYGLTGVVQPYNSYLTGINQDVSTAGSPSFVGATVGASGLTATKQPGVAGLMAVYNATTTSTLYSGFMGMASQTESFVYQLPAEPTVAGYVWSLGVPTGGGDPNGNKVSTITPVYPALSSVGAQVTLATGGSTARTITVDDAAQTMARRDAGQTFTGVDNFTSPVLTTPEFIGESDDSITVTNQGTGNILLDGTTAGDYNYNDGATAATYTPIFTTLPASGKVRYVTFTFGGGSGVITKIWTNVTWMGTTTGSAASIANKYDHYACIIRYSTGALCTIIAEASTN